MTKTGCKGYVPFYFLLALTLGTSVSASSLCNSDNSRLACGTWEIANSFGASPVPVVDWRPGSFAAPVCRIPHRDSLNATVALTVVAAVRPLTLDGDQTIVHKGVWSLGLGDRRFVFSAGGAVVSTPAGPGPAQVIGVFDSAHLSIFLDGRLAGRVPHIGRLAHNAQPANVGERFVGSIERIRIYNAVLKVEDVAALAAGNDAASRSVGPRVSGTCVVSCSAFLECRRNGVYLAQCNSVCERDGNPCETRAMARQRHAHVAARRDRSLVICHRGASAFAKENTLEAYRACLELGADGNEVDVRRTNDGVAVAFHDDMLDFQLAAVGDVSDYTWAELRRFRFRQPGHFGRHARIPTLAEVLELHQRTAGLLLIDLKDDVGSTLSDLLNTLDMWDHVLSTEDSTVKGDARFRRTSSILAVTVDHADFDPAAIQSAISAGPETLLVDDPRGVLHALDRTIGRPSTIPVWEIPQRRDWITPPPDQYLARTLREAPGWNVLHVEQSARDAAASAIATRAMAANLILRHAAPGDDGLVQALEQRIRARSLHQNWQYHGLDGAAALHALAVLRPPRAIELARLVLFRDDPDLDRIREAVVANDTAGSVPLPAMLDWRTKRSVWIALANLPREKEVARVARDFLDLDATQRRRIYGKLDDEAVATLLSAAPTLATARNLLSDPRPLVHGRAIQELLARIDEPWAREALSREAPETLDWLPD